MVARQENSQPTRQVLQFTNNQRRSLTKTKEFVHRMHTKKNGRFSIQGDHDWLPISLNNHEPVQYYYSLLSIKERTAKGYRTLQGF